MEKPCRRHTGYGFHVVDIIHPPPQKIFHNPTTFPLAFDFAYSYNVRVQATNINGEEK